MMPTSRVTKFISIVQGTPYIYAEKCAIETVLQFAFQRLNFIPENIILFGWSIGGFASSYASTIYPDIRAVVRKENKYRATTTILPVCRFLTERN